MRGITIVLYKKEQIGVDAFNRPIYEKKREEIADVLIAPAQEQEILDTLNLTGRKAVYTLAIPKGDTHEWENSDRNAGSGARSSDPASVEQESESGMLWHRK